MLNGYFEVSNRIGRFVERCGFEEDAIKMVEYAKKMGWGEWHYKFIAYSPWWENEEEEK